jgi:CHAT domain-containing protein/tetratricopeptide (TPR) repeat protein
MPAAPRTSRLAHWAILALAPLVGAQEDQLKRAADLDLEAKKLHAEGSYADAIRPARESLAILEEVYGRDHLEVARSLGSLAELLHSKGATAEARSLHERALAIREKELGSDHLDVARSLNSLASVLQTEGRLAEARPLFERSLAIREKELGSDHLDVARGLNNLGLLLLNQHLLAEARPLLERALAIREKGLGPDDPAVATVLTNLALLSRAEGAYADARPLLERALAIHERALGPDHPDVARSLDNLGGLLQAQGFNAEARPLYERALAIRERRLGPDHAAVAMSLNGLGMLLHDMGAFAEARPLYERALAIREKRFGRDHPAAAQCLNNLGMLLQDQGSFAEALPLLHRALEISEKALGPDHLQVATNLNNLALLLRMQRSYAEAQPLYERALAIREKAHGPDHPEVASSLGNLAALLRVEGAYAEARPLYERALVIWEQALGPDHPLVATCLNNLAMLLDDQGAYAEARPLLERALAIRERAFGQDHPAVGQGLRNLAFLFQDMGLFQDAETLYDRALGSAERSLLAGFVGLSPAQRVRFAALQRGCLDRWLAFAPRVGRSGYPEVLRFKGLAARASASERALMRSADSGTLRTVHDLRGAESALSRLANAMPAAAQADQLARWRNDYAKTAAEREKLSLALAKDFAPYRQALERLDIGAGQIQAHLRDDEALVDTLRSGGRYLAWVLAREGDAERLDLGDALEIDALAEAFVAATRRAEPGAAGRGVQGPADATTEASDAGRRLRAMVWEGIAAKLPKGVSTVYVAPDAALATIPFAALPGSAPGRCLIEDVAVVFVSMAQDLVPRTSGAAGAGALVVGGIDFGAAPAPADGGRGPRGGFAPLPGTAAEAAAVGARLGDGTLVVVGSEATEARLRREVKGRRVLHLATHGFVREDLLRGLRIATAEAAVPGLERHLAAGHDPMLLSGLAMAGANAGDGSAGDDGVLTALEASTLDLEACDLVVLSACETARGTAEAGEGVLGLVAGFRSAGASRVIGSLWRVDDEATGLLMQRFYEGILRKEDPLSPARSLRAAALWIRTQKGAGGRLFAAPRYWAAFIAYGK